jgi:predicted RNA binding protein YcfA (HicA-like mRNA interferase family)
MPSASELPALSSGEVIKALGRCGFSKATQTGSHVKMVRVLPDGKHPVIVPHPYSRLPFGTLKSILLKVEKAGVTSEVFLSKVK